MQNLLKKSIILLIIILMIFNLFAPNIISHKLNVKKNKNSLQFYSNSDIVEEKVSTVGSNNRDYPEILWWYDLDAPSFGSAATDDFDNDGYLELAFGTYFNDEHVYALNANNGTLHWNYDTGGCNDASPVIYDVDLDGELEVIIPASSPYMVYCFDGTTGDVEWTRSTGYPNCIDSPPAVADVDNDNKPEVILGAWYGYVFCLNGEDGSICWQKNLGSDSYFQAGPNILDLDNNGQLDIVIAQWEGDYRIYALKGDDGSTLWYSDLPQDNMYHGGSFADIDEDGLPEIVIGCYDNYVYVLNGENGSLLWKYYAPYSVSSPTSIADLKNDNHLEIVFTSYNYLGVLSHNGSLLWSYTTGGGMFRGASIADIDGNGILDVVFGSDDGILRVLQGNNGQVVWTLDLEAHYQNTFQMDNAPVIEDFNGDGKLDIFIIGGYGVYPPDDNHGRAYAIAAGEGTGDGWPMFRHDAYHSACFSFQQDQAPIAKKDYCFTLVNESVWINVTANDYDNDGEIDPTTASIVDYPTNGNVWVDPINGSIFYTPDIGFVGLDILNYTVCDDDGLISNECIVKIFVITSNMIFMGMNLSNGWNLITIPAQTDWWASDISGNLTGCTSISKWNATLQTYDTYIVGGPPTFDFEIEPGCGYFVDMGQPDSLLIAGLPIDTISISLKVGWNLLGWYQDCDTTAISLSENITGCTSVSMWNASLQTYDTYIVGGPPTFDFTINCGMGLFVDVTQESIWYGGG